eukprot:136044-Chlamydomonas_euryale.AAC.2
MTPLTLPCSSLPPPFPASALAAPAYLLLADGALLQQLLGVDFVWVRVVLDLLVHDRLREHGLVDLVVAVLAVADNVDDDVLLEALPPLGRQLVNAHDRLDVVAVDVEDGAVERLCDVGAVGAGAALLGVSRERDLRAQRKQSGRGEGGVRGCGRPSDAACEGVGEGW